MPTTLNLIAPDGQVAQVLTVPTSWQDVTLAQFVYLLAPETGDERTPAELLLGLPAGGLDQVAADAVPLIATLLAFSQDVEPVTSLLPTPGLPDVGGIAYGALLLCQQHLEAHADRPAVASLPYILAVYRTQLRDGKLSDARISETLRALLAAPVTEVWADGQAFLQACRSWQPGMRQTPTPTTTTTKTRKWMPAPKTWLHGLGLRFRSTP